MLWEGDGIALAINHCSADAGSAVATSIEVLTQVHFQLVKTYLPTCLGG